MAEKRMFAKTIIDSDAFLEMPMSARLLYYDLGMRADDDGFVNSPKKIMKIVGATADDMNILIMRKFIIPFDNGIVVIKHWRINNYLRKDRYVSTKYKDQMEMLSVDKEGKYHLKNDNVGTPSGIPAAYPEKNREEKNSINNIYGDSANAKSAEIDDFFSKIWQLYPKKLGKGQVSDKQKRKLLSIGYDEIARCVDRYKIEIEGKDKQYVMYGSTFFNSGYVDYLDENYETDKPPEEEDDAFAGFQ